MRYAVEKRRPIAVENPSNLLPPHLQPPNIPGRRDGRRPSVPSSTQSAMDSCACSRERPSTGTTAGIGAGNR